MQETSSETDPNKCYYLFYDKGEEAIQWRKDDLSLCGSRRTGCPYAKNKPKKKKKNPEKPKMQNLLALDLAMRFQF